MAISISELSIPEKLQLMEALWADLSSNQSTIESPEWHGDVLEQRLHDVESGTASFKDWDAVKKSIVIQRAATGRIISATEAVPVVALVGAPRTGKSNVYTHNR